MHPVLVLALLNVAGAIEARSSLQKANAAVLSMIEKGYDLSTTQQTAIDTINGLIQDIIQHAATQTVSDQGTLDTLVGVVNRCSSDAQDSLDGPAAAKLTTAGTFRTTHSTCRTDEAALATEMSTKCGQYTTHRTNPTNKAPECVATHLDHASTSSDDPTVRGEMEACVVAVKAWSETFIGLMDPCNTATAAHGPKKAECDGDQGHFEDKYCAWTDKIDTTCDTQTSCRTNNIAALETSAAVVATSVASRKADFVAAKRIECYLGVFKATLENRDTVLSGCRAASYNTDHLNVAASTPDAAVTCTRETSKPCVALWTNTEYNSQDWYQHAPTEACDPCS